jgi:hypothetical protein
VKDAGAYNGSVELLVEDGDGRNGGVRREPETAAEKSPSTAMLRR